MAGQFGIAYICDAPLRYSSLPLGLRRPKGSSERWWMAQMLADPETQGDNSRRYWEGVGRSYAERMNALFWREFNKRQESGAFDNPDKVQC